LKAARPNPSAGNVTLGYSLAKRGRTSLRIYSPSGRLVRNLVGAELPAGVYEAVWDGRNEAGARLGAGVYFYRVESGALRAERKLTLLNR
jgi:flagellar hook assembly protein FlgD